MTKIDSILYDALIAQGLIAKDALEALVKDAKDSPQALGALLLSRKLISEKELLALLANELKLDFIEARSLSIGKGVIDKVPLRIASYYKFLPMKLHGRVLTIGVAYPLEVKTQDEIRTQLGYDIEMALVLSSDIEEGLKKYYGFATETLEKISPAGAANEERLAEGLVHEAVEDIEKLADDASVIKLVNQIILEGWKRRATDIHIEPHRGGVYLRYRVDGLLCDANIPGEIKGFLSAIISRIKIMSNLNIVERRLPQDGRAIVKVQEQMLDLRISTIPTPFGESVVIRILPASMLFSLEKLGLSKRELGVFELLIQKPHGIIFVTGPTGSGKTTTLYTCLSRINTRDHKIITIEDPIEYEMSGITQIQVMPEIGLDFARGLRSILRHDPDVIMVGEVRDLETAEIAIRVALTGHLVFSTLHTNDAASGITRLMDIGVEPYLLASSVEAFIAQRLIRLICNGCKYEDKAAPAELKNQIAIEMGIKSSEVRIYRGKGCSDCNFTGFFGRAAIYEVLLLDSQIKDLILKKASSAQIKKTALDKGMRTLRQDGWQKVISGLTTPEEIMKATPASQGSQVEAGIEAAPPEFRGAGAQGADASASEKRVFKRLNKKVDVHYKVLESKEGLISRGLTSESLSMSRDISAGGVLFISEKPIALSSVLDIKVEIPGSDEPIECLAKVVRVEEIEANKSYDIAVCFLDISSGQRSRLNKYAETET